LTLRQSIERHCWKHSAITKFQVVWKEDSTLIKQLKWLSEIMSLNYKHKNSLMKYLEPVLISFENINKVLDSHQISSEI
jgi:hypothetical protein